jgi:ketosteroid isomerase-like protein
MPDSRARTASPSLFRPQIRSWSNRRKKATTFRNRAIREEAGMKSFALGCVLAIACAFSCLPAQAGPAEETQIRALLDRWKHAVHDKDVEAVQSIYAPGKQFVVYDMIPPLKYVGFDSYRKNYEDFFAQYDGPINVVLRDVTIVADRKVAFSYGLEQIGGKRANGQTQPVMWFRFTQCYRKIGGRWFAAHDHLSVPVDFDSGKALTNLEP